MGNPVVHFEIITPEAKRLHDFYSEAFGWSIDANNPMNYGVVRTEAGKGIDGGIGLPGGGAERSLTFYIEVDDVDAMLKKLESLGARTIMPKTDIPNMVTMAVFEDPDGNQVGLVAAHIPT